MKHSSTVAKMTEQMLISVILPLKLDWEPYYSANEEYALEKGSRVEVLFAGKKYIGVVSGFPRQAEVMTGDKPIKVNPIEAPSALPKVSEKEIRLWRTVASYYMCTVGEVYKAAYPGMRTQKEEKAVISKRRKKEDVPGESISTAPELSEDQERAYNEIRKAFDAGKPVLLNGVTGAGKTEIYIKLALEALGYGAIESDSEPEFPCSVLYLVPEIALSRQLEERLRRYFGDKLLCFHSGITTAAKEKVCDKLRQSDGWIVLGTRSAVFLPFRKLGLVIVDEEHDRSYKQDSPAPRYNGRDTAALLASIHGCPIVTGSATPSFESTYNCATGRYAEIHLDKPYHGQSDTETIIIDTKREKRRNGMVGSISRELIALIKQTVSEGGQVMVLRGRKAYATAIQCSLCGHILKCPRCNVSLTYSKSCGRLVCNHCGYSAPWSDHIPHPGPEGGTCNGLLTTLGAGTEKIEEEIASIFPELRVDRLDSEVSAGPARLKEVLRKFSAGETDILVGTQMLTKGFDFENLRLVAVLGADSLLGQQDFRADEKAVQLLEQFRGRCARRGQKGIFAIQTAQPDHPVYKMLVSGEPQLQKSSLMQERKDFDYPPYTRIINLLFKDRNLVRITRLSSKLSLMLRSEGIFPGKGVQVSAAFAPAVDKVKDEYLRTIRVTLPRDSFLHSNKEKLKNMLDSFCKEEKYAGNIAADVDPA
ncbi:MAG: primosomal protein N' [Candidatus Cryptobacteroides sp.]|nr:primosomal protein N' [Candidatus Cryptobacteroides sp.]